MTRPHSLAFKQNVIQRLTGKDALSASQLAAETGVRQQNCGLANGSFRDFFLDCSGERPQLAVQRLIRAVTARAPSLAGTGAM